MRRGIVLAVLLTLGGVSLGVAAYQQPPVGGQPAPRVIQVVPVKDNLYLLRGGGGNTAVLVAEDGVVVVDTKNPGWGQLLLDAIRELTSKPVTTIINTHSHYDHASGNVEFPATVEIVAHANTKSNMENGVPVAGVPLADQPANVFESSNGRGLPTQIFTDRMSLGRGDDRIDLYYFGRGHTNGDAWVIFPTLRVMHAGDIFARKGLPLLDANNGGSGVAIPETLAKAANAVGNDVDTIITGHSDALMTMDDLREFANFNRDFLAAMQEARQAGRSIDDVVNSWQMPAGYTGYGAPSARLRSNVEILFEELR
jgi:cyclase